jgi:hypothetical protein
MIGKARGAMASRPGSGSCDARGRGRGRGRGGVWGGRGGPADQGLQGGEQEQEPGGRRERLGRGTPGFEHGVAREHGQQHADGGEQHPPQGEAVPGGEIEGAGKGGEGRHHPQGAGHHEQQNEKLGERQLGHVRMGGGGSSVFAAGASRLRDVRPVGSPP